MTSVPQQTKVLQQILEEEAVRLAKETGFIQRERAFTGADFAQALILGWLHVKCGQGLALSHFP